MPAPWHTRKEKVAAWEKRNREQGRLPYFMDRARSLNWKAKKRYKSKGTVTGQQLMDLYLAEKACLYCGENLEPGTTHFDHITPLAKGGANTLINLCCACGPCNQTKNDKDAQAFVRYVEDTMEPEAAYNWILEYKQALQRRISEAVQHGQEEVDLEDWDLLDF